ncbi:MAG TPA: hypothetical protein VD948_06290 [Rhodothermales bacterium]|nr:hypothetical protein [Rhodothermales bacterium]
MSRRKNAPVATEQLVLGISVSGRTLHGVLVERTPEGARLLRHLTRTRGEALAPTSVAAMATAGTFALADGDDNTGEFLQIGDSGNKSELFLGSEFASLGLTSNSATQTPASGKKAANVVPPQELFVNELLDMMAEVRDALGQDPTLAFVASPDDVTYAEVTLPLVAKEKADRRRTRLLSALTEQVHDVDNTRTVFLPMPEAAEGQLHALALVPRTADPVVHTVRGAMEHRRTMRARLLDTELSLLIGLARMAPLAPPTYDDFYSSGSASGDGAGRVAGLSEEDGAFAPTPPAPPADGTTLVLRAGIEDTLAIFLRDGQVHYFERMRSVTAFDAPETLCSRVLLIQDEHGVGELGRVLLLGEQGEADLIDAFSLFFPEANVGSIRAALPGALAEEAMAVREAGPTVALAAALRLSGTGEHQAYFPDLNFMPATFSRRRFVVPYTWHVYALLGLLFVTALFFVGRFLLLEREISQQRADVRLVDPSAAEADVQQLQVRLDSLQTAQARYTHALGVLDSLLRGSDRWSRALDLLSREANASRGLWIDNWSHNGDVITLVGNATSRDQVVAFAERTGGSLQELKFEEIRDFGTYSFTLTLPLAGDLPEAVRYLRDLAARQAGFAPDPMPDAMAPQTPAPQPQTP